MPETEAWEYSLSIPHDPRAVTVCRRTLRLILTMHGLIRLADTAELLASEPVANAVLHTKGPATLRVRWSAGVLRIGAWDADPEPPDPPRDLASLTDAEEGRGLALIRACADVWGWQPLARNGSRGQVRLVRAGGYGDLLTPVFGVLGIALPERVTVYAVPTGVPKTKGCCRRVGTFTACGTTSSSGY